MHGKRGIVKKVNFRIFPTSNSSQFGFSAALSQYLSLIFAQFVTWTEGLAASSYGTAIFLCGFFFLMLILEANPVLISIYNAIEPNAKVCTLANQGLIKFINHFSCIKLFMQLCCMHVSIYECTHLYVVVTM